MPIDKNSQTSLTLSWDFYGAIKYETCYTIDGGVVWYKQASSSAFITVNGNYLRTPWYVLTILWVVSCVMIQLYCNGRKIKKKQNK